MKTIIITKIILGIVLNILFMTMAHELYHVYQLKQIGAKIGDVCFFGYSPEKNKSFLMGGFGWVYGYTDKNIDEITPTIISIVVSVMFSAFYMLFIL